MEKLRSAARGLKSKLPARSNLVYPLVFKPVHFLIMIFIGLMIAIPSLSRVIDSYIPLSWENTAGTVNDVAQNESVEGVSRYVAVIGYRVNGEQYTVREEYVGERPSRNDAEAVYYNPKDPSESLVYRSGSFDFLYWVPLMAGVGVLVLASVRQYIAYRRGVRIKNMVKNGKALATEVVDVREIDRQSLLQKLIYGRDRIFKITTAPLTEAGSFESGPLVWHRGSSSDVESLSRDGVAVVVYQDGDNPGLYYVDPPKIEPVEPERVADEVSSVGSAEDTSVATGSVSSEVLSVANAPADSVEVAGLFGSTPLELTTSKAQPIPIDLDLPPGPATPVKSTVIESAPESLPDSSKRVEFEDVVVDEDGLDASVINELEASLAAMNSTASPTKIEFSDSDVRDAAGSGAELYGGGMESADEVLAGSIEPLKQTEPSAELSDLTNLSGLDPAVSEVGSEVGMESAKPLDPDAALTSQAAMLGLISTDIDIPEASGVSGVESASEPTDSQAASLVDSSSVDAAPVASSLVAAPAPASLANLVVTSTNSVASAPEAEVPLSAQAAPDASSVSVVGVGPAPSSLSPELSPSPTPTPEPVSELTPQVAPARSRSAAAVAGRGNRRIAIPRR